MDTNIKYLVDNGINIWNKDAYNYFKSQLSGEWYELKNLTLKDFIEAIKNNETGYNFDNYVLGDLGRVYGAQWRDWQCKDNFGVTWFKDQISNLIKGLKETPMGTKHIVTAWNPAELDDMALPPCHWSFEILVEPLSKTEILMKLYEGVSFSDMNFQNPNPNKNVPRYKFTLKWHQRSVDTFLGLPFNIASYATLAHIIGKMTNMVPKAIIGDLSNVHIYENHLDAVKEQLSRDLNKHGKCELNISSLGLNNLEHNKINTCLDNLNIDNFQLDNYKSYPAIKAKMLAYDN